MDRPFKIFACITVILFACLCLLTLTGVGTIILYNFLQERMNSGPETAGTPLYETLLPRTPANDADLLSTPTTRGERPLDLPEGLEINIWDRAPEEAFQNLAALAGVTVPAGDRLEQTERLKGVHDIPLTVQESAPVLPIGTESNFQIINMDNDEQYTITAELRYVTSHVYFWVENGVSARDESIQELVDRFEDQTYPTDRAFFGSEWTPGIDGDPHLYILYARNLGSMVGGYYSSTDEVSQLAHAFSNQHEMFYINADTSPLGMNFTGGILAHEFQHMIQWHTTRNEETWLIEGFAELAAFLNGFNLGGFDRMYLYRPDIQMNYWPDINDSDSVYHYGSSFLFVDYFYGRFGEDAIRALVQNPQNGMASIDDTLQAIGAADPESGRLLTADDVMADFSAALLLDDPSVAEGQYQFSDYDVTHQPSLEEDIADCPTGAHSGEATQYGIDYLRIACAGRWRFFFAGQTTQRVLPADPAEGLFAAWSNRGDDSDMTMTRTFNLPAGSPATLQFRLWYDVEDKYDYAYLEISTDGGETWEILETRYGTRMNPQGNNFGWGWTGKSGGGEEAAWIQEEVDLTPFAGNSVLVRFEYITDPAQHGEGLMVDDIRIPQLGYAAGFEDGLDGWETKGFVRLQNLLPQTYRVRVIRRGNQTTVEDLALDGRMFGSFDLVVEDGGDAVIAIIGTNRFTIQTAQYQYQLLE